MKHNNRSVNIDLPEGKYYEMLGKEEIMGTIEIEPKGVLIFENIVK